MVRRIAHDEAAVRLGGEDALGSLAGQGAPVPPMVFHPFDARGEVQVVISDCRRCWKI